MQGTLVDGGHFTLTRPVTGSAHVTAPDGEQWGAAITDTTCASLEEAAREVQYLRAAGGPATLALMVGDLVVPPGRRHRGGAWAIPAAYLEILQSLGVDPDEVVVLGEAYCRNQGKRRVLDEARTRAADPERTYAEQGWALLADATGLRLVSDASLDWDADVKSVALTSGAAPLCPLVFAGLKRWIFRRGFTRHVAVYALADDPWIDAKLRGAATALAQLWQGPVGEQIHRVRWADVPRVERVERADVVSPGELSWDEFYAQAKRAHPGLCRVEEARWSVSSNGAACTTVDSGSSRSSG